MSLTAAWARRLRPVLALGLLGLLLWTRPVLASAGDRLPEFRECVDVCIDANCGQPGVWWKDATPIPLHRRLLLWTCPAECDHTCQHMTTAARVAAGAPILQFHGKWPFRRLLGAQEPASVLFSLANLYAHAAGLRKLRRRLPPAYRLRAYYEGLALVSMAAWVASAVFHTRDFPATEKADYFAAGASVLYALYYTVIRLARLDGDSPRPSPRRRSVRRAWAALCLLAYAGHVGYLGLVRWDYGYNMAANVGVGVVQNALWSGYSVLRYRRTHRAWAVWPGITVAWVMMAMGLELFDFPPLGGVLDAHSLWHAATVGPTVLWYNFLVMDAQDDIASAQRLKA